MQVYRSALSACVMKDLPNVEYYMPLDRDRLEEGRKIIVRNRPNNNDDTERVDNESVNTVATQVNNNQIIDVDDDDDVIIID